MQREPSLEAEGSGTDPAFSVKPRVPRPAFPPACAISPPSALQQTQNWFCCAVSSLGCRHLSAFAQSI